MDEDESPRRSIDLTLRVSIPADVQLPTTWPQAHRLIRGMGPVSERIELLDSVESNID